MVCIKFTDCQIHVKGCITVNTNCSLLPLPPPLPPAPPSLIAQGVVGLAEGDVASVDLSDTAEAEAFPLPGEGQFLWMMGGSGVSSGTRVTYGYPSVMFNAVERGDAGDYTLSATNTRPNGSEIGSDTGSFTLDVYCKPRSMWDC